jgi:ankyrin repeat protein
METEVLCQACTDNDVRKVESYLSQLSADAVNRNNIKGMLSDSAFLLLTVGDNALLCATLSGATECVLALLNYEQLKLIDKQNKMLQTPLMNAASKGYCDIVALLLAAGADTSKKVRASLRKFYCLFSSL